jgi:hypothetical protein
MYNTSNPYTPNIINTTSEIVRVQTYSGNIKEYYPHNIPKPRCYYKIGDKNQDIDGILVMKSESPVFVYSSMKKSDYKDADVIIITKEISIFSTEIRKHLDKDKNNLRIIVPDLGATAKKDINGEMYAVKFLEF